MGSERLSRFTTHEFLALDLVHREQAIPESLRGRVNHLVNQGVIEPIGRGKFILSRSLYAFLGQKGVYTRKRGLDRETQKALLLKHIADNQEEGSRLEELIQVLPALTPDQVQTLVQELKSGSAIHNVGKTKAARWFPGPGPENDARE